MKSIINTWRKQWEEFYSRTTEDVRQAHGIKDLKVGKKVIYTCVWDQVTITERIVIDIAKQHVFTISYQGIKKVGNCAKVATSKDTVWTGMEKDDMNDTQGKCMDKVCCLNKVHRELFGKSFSDFYSQF